MNSIRRCLSRRALYLVSNSRMYSSRASDRTYLRRQGTCKKYNHSFEMHTLPFLQQFPKLMETYFSVAAVMKQKNLVPLTTAQSAAFRPARIFIETISGRKAQDSFRYLRDPTKKFQITTKDAKDRIQKYLRKYGCSDFQDMCCGGGSKPDNSPLIRPYVLSASYHLVETGQAETASFFAFSNQSCGFSFEIERHCEEAIKRMLAMKGFHDKTKEILSAIRPFFVDYDELDLGQIFVVGVPKDKIDEFAYDSKTFGIPSGEKISSFIDNTSLAKRAYTQQETPLQARLFMTKETLQPSSGLEVISLNDNQECAQYIRGYPLIAPREVPEYKEILLLESTKKETEHWRNQEALDCQIKKIASSLI